MKVSELIEKLNKALVQYGDISVRVRRPGYGKLDECEMHIEEYYYRNGDFCYGEVQILHNSEPENK